MKGVVNINAETAKKMLTEGNRRYLAANTGLSGAGTERREELAEKGQKPFALIVCCSDSRVPPELVFNCGLGDLFVVRTAGNVLDSVCLGSIEYGAEHLAIPLIVVLGHENCGAVKAAVDGGKAHGCLKAITGKIAAVYDRTATISDPYGACEDANILNTVEEIRQNSVIRELIDEGKVTVVGAKYGIKSGVVRFF